LVGDLSRPNTGLLLVLPIIQAFGLQKKPYGKKSQ
jgi:hypothetical protein